VIDGKSTVGQKPGSQTRGPKCHHSRHEKLEELGASSRKPYVACSVHCLVVGEDGEARRRTPLGFMLADIVEVNRLKSSFLALLFLAHFSPY
jgi:hypothetical protein